MASTNNNTAPKCTYSGTWTREEQEYVKAIIEEFRAGNLPDAQGRVSLRKYIASKLSCAEKRITKKLERSKYNGRLAYTHRAADLSPEESKRRLAKLRELELEFLKSRERLILASSNQERVNYAAALPHGGHSQVQARAGQVYQAQARAQAGIQAKLAGNSSSSSPTVTQQLILQALLNKYQSKAGAPMPADGILPGYLSSPPSVGSNASVDAFLLRQWRAGAGPFAAGGRSMAKFGGGSPAAPSLASVIQGPCSNTNRNSAGMPMAGSSLMLGNSLVHGGANHSGTATFNRDKATLNSFQQALLAARHCPSGAGSEGCNQERFVPRRQEAVADAASALPNSTSVTANSLTVDAMRKLLLSHLRSHGTSTTATITDDLRESHLGSHHSSLPIAAAALPTAASSSLPFLLPRPPNASQTTTELKLLPKRSAGDRGCPTMLSELKNDRPTKRFRYES